jgi:hypothetical protein
MRVLSVDPGETTGFVIVDVNTEPLFTGVYGGEWKGLDDLYYLVTHRNMVVGVDVVVIEKYVVYPNRLKTHIGDSLLTAQMIGAVKYVCQAHDINEVIEQPASMAKQRWPNRRIRKYFNLPRGWSRHIIDALRHFLTALEVTYKIKPSQLKQASVLHE